MKVNKALLVSYKSRERGWWLLLFAKTCSCSDFLDAELRAAELRAGEGLVGSVGARLHRGV